MKKIHTFFLILSLSLIGLPFVFAGPEVGAITDPLRQIANEAMQFDYITRIVVFVFSLAVAVVGILAWKRNPSPRVKYIALAFILFSFKWALKVMDLFVSTGSFFPDHAENVLELISLALIAYAIFMPRKGK